MARVMIFIDGSNVFRSLDLIKRGYRLDYGKLVKQLVEDNQEFVRTYYYASEDIPPIERQSNLYRELRDNLKFDTTILPLKVQELRNGKLKKEEKGIDVSLAVDMLSMAHKDGYDIAVLVAGDSDYLKLVRAVKDAGKRVKVVAIKKSGSFDLMASSDYPPCWLDTIADKIQIDPKTTLKCSVCEKEFTVRNIPREPYYCQEHRPSYPFRCAVCGSEETVPFKPDGRSRLYCAQHYKRSLKRQNGPLAVSKRPVP
jgi:CxxC-x17-CxxC domain-containing protein